jgi:type I restriction enzyme S subunit
MSNNQSTGAYPTRPLAELAVRITDGSHFSPEPQREGRLIANVKDMKHGSIDFESCTKISDAAYRELLSSGCTIKKGDVLLSKDGTVGRVVVYGRDEEIGALSSICLITPRPESSARFLGQALQSHGCLRQYDNFMSGSALRRLVLRDIRQIAIPTPPPEYQAAIADVLDTLDTTIRQTEAIIAKLKQVKQGLLHDLLTRGIDANGELRPPQSEAPHLYKASSLGWIPVEWSISSVDSACADVVDCPHSTPVFADAGALVARTMHIKDGRFLETIASRVSEAEYAKRIQRLEPEPGDVVFTREAPVGEAFVIPDGMRICLGQRVMLLRPSPGKLLGSFLTAQIYSGVVADRISALTAGTTNPHLNVSDVRQFILPLPPFREQVEIDARLNGLERRIRAEASQLEKLAVLKSGLMDDLLTGRIRVTTLLQTQAA